MTVIGGGGVSIAMDMCKEYSKHLGKLTPHQFQAALSRFNLGTFLSATPVKTGLFGQNIIISSTKGKFILRGNPHYPWQFPKERYGAELLHKYTKVPVPYPYLLDSGMDIFGWNYIIMPFMRGVHPECNTLSSDDKVNIAFALGRNLAELHQCKWDFCGQYELSADSIKPFKTKYSEWFASDINYWLAKSNEHDGICKEEENWVREYLKENIHFLTDDFQPCFVMNDYNPGNVVVQRDSGKWIVSGIFDLMEYYFGDGSADLVRLIAIYMDNHGDGARDLINAFISGYYSETKVESNIIDKYKLFMLRDRLIVWQYGTRSDVAWFSINDSFYEYIKPYIEVGGRFCCFKQHNRTVPLCQRKDMTCLFCDPAPINSQSTRTKYNG